VRPDLGHGVVTLAGIAPYDGADGWFAGMTDDGGLRAPRGPADSAGLIGDDAAGNREAGEFAGELAQRETGL
jgi:hypothetical protein